MLKETYLAKMKQTARENPYAAFIVVTRSAGHMLSPSWKLLNDYKAGRADWAQYTERFRREMDCDLCRKEMKRIWDLSQKKDVYLVCYEKPGQNCHRHLLMDIMHMRFGELRDTDKFIFFRSVLLPAIWSKSKGRKRNMKVLAINSSPMMDEGNTALILNPFLEGMREAGANVELFYTRKLRINPCQGEFNCWVKTPGKCFQNDDMQMLDPKMRDADILVFATPVYCDGITGHMKNLLDRTLPQVYPFFELRDGHCRHPLREDTKSSKVVLVSNCGFWEMDNFDPMLAHIKAYCRNGDNEFAGALLRPHGGALKPMMEMGAPIDDIFDAAKEAGRQLVRDGRMSEQTLNIVSRELMPRDMYVESANQYFRDELKANAKIG